MYKLMRSIIYLVYSICKIIIKIAALKLCHYHGNGCQMYYPAAKRKGIDFTVRTMSYIYIHDKEIIACNGLTTIVGQNPSENY